MTTRKKKIILNVIFYVFLAIIYSFTIAALITKFTGGTMYFFNSRVDVVLTDSMSSRNKNHLDFLEGTTQIQKMDMVISEKITDNTVIEVKDCVLFRNPKLNNQTVVHRVIDVIEEGYSFSISLCEKTTFNDMPMTLLIDNPDHSDTGEIYLSSLNVTDVVIEAYTAELNSSYLVFFLGGNPYDLSAETTKISDNVYKHVLTYARTSSAPQSTKIALGTDKPVYISKITYTSKTKGDFVYDSSELVVKEDKSYSKMFDSRFLYEIRADKSAASDGIFERSQIFSKVKGIIPKLGHIVHFLQSIPGMIMLVGLAIIITFASYLMTKSVKKTPKISENGTTEVVEASPDIIQNNAESPPSDEAIEEKEEDKDET